MLLCGSFALPFAQRTAGASRHPAFPAPSWPREGGATRQSSGELRREAAKACVRVVGWVEHLRNPSHSGGPDACWVSLRSTHPTSACRRTAMLPHTPSLRAQRSNPESFRGGILDCFRLRQGLRRTSRCARNDDGEAACQAPRHRRVGKAERAHDHAHRDGIRGHGASRLCPPYGTPAGCFRLRQRLRPTSRCAQ